MGMHPDDLRSKARRLHLAGMSNVQIARTLVIPYGTIGYWLHRDREAGLLDPIDRSWNPECPRCRPVPTTPEKPSAYCYLLGQYLGDGHIVVTPKTTVLRIFCSNAYQSILDECYVAMRRTLGRRVHLAYKTGCTGVCSYHRHWTCIFPQHGEGRKHDRRIVLEDWQRELVAAYPRPFLRGLIHADGCRALNHTTRNGRRYEYPRYHFANESVDILQLCGWALDLVGVRWRFNRRNSISVARREGVALLDGFIGPKT